MEFGSSSSPLRRSSQPSRKPEDSIPVTDSSHRPIAHTPSSSTSKNGPSTVKDTLSLPEVPLSKRSARQAPKTKKALTPQEEQQTISEKQTLDAINQTKISERAKNLDRFKVPIPGSNLLGSLLKSSKSIGGTLLAVGGILLFANPAIGASLILAGITLAAVGTFAKMGVEYFGTESSQRPPLTDFLINNIFTNSNEFKAGIDGAILGAFMIGSIGILLTLTPIGGGVALVGLLAAGAAMGGTAYTYFLGNPRHPEITAQAQAHATQQQKHLIERAFQPLAQVYKGKLHSRETQEIQKDGKTCWEYTVITQNIHLRPGTNKTRALSPDQKLSNEDWIRRSVPKQLVIDEATLDKVEFLMKGINPNLHARPQVQWKTYAWVFDLLAQDDEFREEFTNFDLSNPNFENQASSLRRRINQILMCHANFESCDPYDVSETDLDSLLPPQLRQAIANKHSVGGSELRENRILKKGIEEIYKAPCIIGQSRKIVYQDGSYQYSVRVAYGTETEENTIEEKAIELEINTERLDKIHDLIESTQLHQPPLFQYSGTEYPQRLDIYIRAFDLFAMNEDMLKKLDEWENSIEPNEPDTLKDKFYEIMSTHSSLQNDLQYKISENQALNLLSTTENLPSTEDGIPNENFSLASQIKKRQFISSYNAF